MSAQADGRHDEAFRSGERERINPVFMRDSGPTVYANRPVSECQWSSTTHHSPARIPHQ